MSEVAHVEFLVEEPSAEVALLNLVPRILRPEISFEIRVFNGKPDLLGKGASNNNRNQEATDRLIGRTV